MATEEEVQEVQPEEEATSLADFFEPFKAFIDTLDPPQRVEIADAFGNTYDCSAILPARAQFRVFRALRAIGELQAETTNVKEVTDLINIVMEALEDEHMVQMINQAFQAAHPKAVAEAAVAGKAAESELLDPIDLFPIEEIIRGLLPFLVRLVGRVGGMISEMKSETSTQ